MKLARAMATKNMETSTTADVLVSHLLSPMGVPEKNYMSHLNGQIERGYRTMLSVATVDNSFQYTPDSIQETQRRYVRQLKQTSTDLRKCKSLCCSTK
ncbi:hypothetical protein T4D_11824 [Trichinella pseudospiralis]|uniref:Uncharacterized protein n=1 Tax=Trichinella pseudospiralis TaxID=6337 RepID=A0A0V1G5R9_TRIPS|nr:hypothetical protein T4D_11824 [Trichinella pseudospiralis]